MLNRFGYVVRTDEDRQEIERLKREAALRRSFVDVAFRFFLYGERGPHVEVSFDSLKPDSDPDWIPQILERGDMHEPEFCVFRFFQNPHETVLDVGANSGYSVTSILASGSKAQILSFEPNPMHHKCLERLRELRKGTFDFVPTGLGANTGRLNFLVPVINDVAVSGLSSANFEKTIAWVAQENFVSYALEHCQGVPDPQLRFAECNWPIARLDDALRHNYEVIADRIVAIKIDVEGHEASVLEGARATLQLHKPLIMIEGANRDPGVRNVLGPLGYVFADFDGNACVVDDRISMKTNGFFLHTSELDHYRDIGLLSREHRLKQYAGVMP
jgi:FkbM family methyltransferase